MRPERAAGPKSNAAATTKEITHVLNSPYKSVDVIAFYGYISLLFPVIGSVIAPSCFPFFSSSSLSSSFLMIAFYPCSARRWMATSRHTRPPRASCAPPLLAAPWVCAAAAAAAAGRSAPRQPVQARYQLLLSFVLDGKDTKRDFLLMSAHDRMMVMMIIIIL